MFTIVEFSKGYYQIEIYDASSFLTTFNTPFGRYVITRMSFGLSVARDVFQHKLHTVFNNLNLCTGIADDMIIWGEEADGSDHNQYLTKFFFRLQENTSSN